MTVPKLTWITTLAVALVALVLAVEQPTERGNSVLPQETAFARVMRTQTLRCGYLPVSPSLVQDPNTGQLSGPVYDLVEEIGKTLNLKIEWHEEVPYATQTEGLRQGRYDMVCAHLYMRPNLMAQAEFLQPYSYVPIYVIQRKGESRFHSTSDLNQPSTKIGAIDGTIPMLITQSDFKNATLYSMPEMTPYSENLLAVVANKADVTLVDHVIFRAFDKENPNQLEIARTIPPLRMFGTTFIVAKGEHNLAGTLNAAMKYLITNGKVDEILRRYPAISDAVLRAAPPYESKVQP